MVYLLFVTSQETHLDKSSEKCSSKIGCDIGRIEMGLTRSDSEEAAVNEATETEIDPWALTDLVDTSEKWSGNYIRILRNDFVVVVSLYADHVCTSNRHIVAAVANMCAL